MCMCVVVCVCVCEREREREGGGGGVTIPGFEIFSELLQSLNWWMLTYPLFNRVV